MRMRFVSRLLAAFLALCVLSPVLAQASDWRKKYPELNIGVITEENQSDMLGRWQSVADYLSKELKVKATIRPATDYAGVIEAMKARKIELAWYGPASFAKAWIVTGKQMIPLVTHTDASGNVGYHSVMVVKTESPYKAVEDLKGKKLALADPNSTSGNQAPRFFLGKQGIDVDTFFGSATFSGSHENSVIGLMNGTFDSAVTWWNSDEFNNVARMQSKGMVPADATRIIWKSPLLPNEPWTMPAWLPEDMRADVKKALLEMPTKAPDVFKKLFDGKSKTMVEVKVEDYMPVVEMIQANLEKRKAQ